MRKGMKLLVAVMVAMTVCAMSVSAFAITVSTTTSYVGDSVTVTTNVTGAEPNEEVAYMVKDSAAAELNSETIYYIDQKAANGEGTVAPFSFTMAKANVSGTATATVLAGTESTAANAANYTVDGANGAVIALKNCTVTYTVTGDGKVFVASADVDLDEVVAGGELAGEGADTITFVVVPDAGKKLATVNGSAVTLTNGAYVYTVPNAETATVAFVFEADVTEKALATVTAPAVDLSNEAAPSVSATGKATGNFTEAGIIVNGVKYPALGFGTDGAFTVTVIETVVEGTVASITADTVVTLYQD